MQQNLDFNLKSFIENSVFYPASGTDFSYISVFLDKGISNFLHVDYSVKKEEILENFKTAFDASKYKLIRISEISKNQITPNGFRPISNIPLNEHENDRLQRLDFVRDNFNGVNFIPFALLVEYELQEKAKATKFSILHIGGEACATFEATYLLNGINPRAIVIIRPSEGYGDNWTLFTNPDFRLYKMLEINANKNNQLLPKYLVQLSDFEMPGEIAKSCWENYQFIERHQLLNEECLNLFSLK